MRAHIPVGESTQPVVIWKSSGVAVRVVEKYVDELRRDSNQADCLPHGLHRHAVERSCKVIERGHEALTVFVI